MRVRAPRGTPLTARSSPVGVFPKPENAVFVPIPVELRFSDAERGGSASLFLSCARWLTAWQSSS